MELVYFLLIGLCAGWLAGQIWRGSDFGLVGNLVVGVVGSLLGGFLFGLVGLSAVGLLGSLICAVAGALALLFLLSKVKVKA